MTDHTFPPEGHLDDDALSSWVDRAAALEEHPPVAAHLERCDRCAARLAELAGVRELVGAPVEALPDDVKESQLRAAVLAFEPGDGGAGTPAPTPAARPLAARKGRRLQAPMAVAASIAILAALGFGAVEVLRHAGSSSAPGAASGTTTAPQTFPSGTNPDTSLGGVFGQLRPVKGPASSCTAFDMHVRGASGPVPDVVAAATSHAPCVQLGLPIAFFGPGTGGSVSVAARGAAGAVGDTITLRSARPATAWPTGTPPAGPSLALVADGAVVGTVRSITVAPGTREATIVVVGVPPPVAEYLASLLS